MSRTDADGTRTSPLHSEEDIERLVVALQAIWADMSLRRAA